MRPNVLGLACLGLFALGGCPASPAPKAEPLDLGSYKAAESIEFEACDQILAADSKLENLLSVRDGKLLLIDRQGGEYHVKGSGKTIVAARWSPDDQFVFVFNSEGAYQMIDTFGEAKTIWGGKLMAKPPIVDYSTQIAVSDDLMFVLMSDGWLHRWEHSPAGIVWRSKSQIIPGGHLATVSVNSLGEVSWIDDSAAEPLLYDRTSPGDRNTISYQVPKLGAIPSILRLEAGPVLIYDETSVYASLESGWNAVSTYPSATKITADVCGSMVTFQHPNRMVVIDTTGVERLNKQIENFAWGRASADGSAIAVVTNELDDKGGATQKLTWYRMAPSAGS